MKKTLLSLLLLCSFVFAQAGIHVEAYDEQQPNIRQMTLRLRVVNSTNETFNNVRLKYYMPYNASRTLQVNPYYTPGATVSQEVVNDQIEINIDYILMLVKKYHDSHGEDKEVLITIRKAIDASPELRSKKQLIENFIMGINEVDDVLVEWQDYVVQQREHDLEVLIESERLKPDETRKFIENAFRDGEIKTTGTDIDKLLPPVSRFGGGNRTEMKKGVIDRLMAYFERFYGMTNAKFKVEE